MSKQEQKTNEWLLVAQWLLKSINLLNKTSSALCIDAKIYTVKSFTKRKVHSNQHSRGLTVNLYDA